MVVKTADIEFFCYHRDRLGSAPLREKLLEEHWSYMDRYATTMVARGPTFASDGDTPTGSVHILDLPDPATARAFAFDEPTSRLACIGTYCCAGGATRWGERCGISSAAGPVATATWYSVSARARRPTSPGRPTEMISAALWSRVRTRTDLRPPRDMDGSEAWWPRRGTTRDVGSGSTYNETTILPIGWPRGGRELCSPGVGQSRHDAGARLLCGVPPDTSRA